jgi:hypothetical protein
VQINTNADAHYNATGLQRVHRRGVELSPLSDSAAAHRSYQAAKDDPKVALAPGIQWKEGDEWVGLMSFHRFEPPPKPKEDETPSEPKPQRVVKGAELQILQESGKMSFMIRYELEGPGARPVSEHYELSEIGVRFGQKLGGDEKANRRLFLPVLVNDGARDTETRAGGRKLSCRRSGGLLMWEVEAPMKLNLALDPPRVPTHNGHLQAATAQLPPGAAGFVSRITLESAPLPQAK